MLEKILLVMLGKLRDSLRLKRILPRIRLVIEEGKNQEFLRRPLTELLEKLLRVRSYLIRK